MRLIQSLVVASLFVSSVSAFSQRASSGEECFAEVGNASARECLAAKANNSESALVQAERHAVSAIERSDEEPMARRRAVGALKAASAAYRRYRKEQCGVQIALAAGGTGGQHRGFLCEIALNEERVSHMRSIRGIGQ